MSGSPNTLLACLHSETLASLRFCLEPVSLTQGYELERAGGPVSHVVFPQSGVLSVFAQANGAGVEVAMIGREGMTGLASVLGIGRSSHTIRVQMSGEGRRVEAGLFHEVLDRHRPLRIVVLKYAHACMAQLSHTGLTAARRSVTERLARWLLMCLDRVDGSELHVTHDALSGALGVRRPGVTVATHILEGDGAIRARRGCISVLDRTKLVAAANGGYGAAESEYAHLFAASAMPRADSISASYGRSNGAFAPG